MRLFVPPIANGQRGKTFSRLLYEAGLTREQWEQL